jgi:hypothetical protein
VHIRVEVNSCSLWIVHGSSLALCRYDVKTPAKGPAWSWAQDLRRTAADFDG